MFAFPYLFVCWLVGSFVCFAWSVWYVFVVPGAWFSLNFVWFGVCVFHAICVVDIITPVLFVHTSISMCIS